MGRDVASTPALPWTVTLSFPVGWMFPCQALLLPGADYLVPRAFTQLAAATTSRAGWESCL